MPFIKQASKFQSAGEVRKYEATQEAVAWSNFQTLKTSTLKAKNFIFRNLKISTYGVNTFTAFVFKKSKQIIFQNLKNFIYGNNHVNVSK